MQTQTIAMPVAVSADVPIERLQGAVLCHFAGGDYADVETALARRGVTILRGCNDLHALSLVRSARPDVVVIAMDDPAQPSHPFLNDLRRTRYGATIPVIALVPSVPGRPIHESSQQSPSMILVPDAASPELVVAEVAQILIHTHRTYRRDDAATANVDAVFSELASRKPRRRNHSSRRPYRAMGAFLRD